jgi:very-short-patch-repair endonuclease
VEVDGNASRMTPETQRHDHRRGNALRRAAWTVLHYHWFEVIEESDRVAAEINQTYRALLAAGNRHPA